MRRNENTKPRTTRAMPTVKENALERSTGETRRHTERSRAKKTATQRSTRDTSPERKFGAGKSATRSSPPTAVTSARAAERGMTSSSPSTTSTDAAALNVEGKGSATASMLGCAETDGRPASKCSATTAILAAPRMTASARTNFTLRSPSTPAPARRAQTRRR